MSEQRLLRRRDAAAMLGVSETTILNMERRGLLQPLRLDAIGRTVRYDAAAVNALADRLIQQAEKAG